MTLLKHQYLSRTVAEKGQLHKDKGLSNLRSIQSINSQLKPFSYIYHTSHSESSINLSLTLTRIFPSRFSPCQVDSFQALSSSWDNPMPQILSSGHDSTRIFGYVEINFSFSAIFCENLEEHNNTFIRWCNSGDYKRNLQNTNVL